MMRSSMGSFRKGLVCWERSGIANLAAFWAIMLWQESATLRHAVIEHPQACRDEDVLQTVHSMFGVF